MRRTRRVQVRVLLKDLTTLVVGAEREGSGKRGLEEEEREERKRERKAMNRRSWECIKVEREREREEEPLKKKPIAIIHSTLYRNERNITDKNT